MAKLERDQKELWSDASSHFIELRAYIGDTLKAHFEKFGAQLDQRFTTIDQRFRRIDERFVRMDHRFDHIDQRFARIDLRFDRLESKLDLFIATQGGINRRHDRRLSALERKLRQTRRPKT